MNECKRPSPSPSRSSLRSEGRSSKASGHPRVIHVNRDASTMVEAEHGDIWDSCGGHKLRTRTFSDGFIGNASLELLLGVADCEECLRLADARQHCADQQPPGADLDLVCNCNVIQNNYLNYPSNSFDCKGQTIHINDFDRMKQEFSRSLVPIRGHRSLDRKHIKSKTLAVSNYLSKQLISYDHTNTLVQKIKRKLSSLKKIRNDTILKKHQNAVQLAEISSRSNGSLKKLSMLSLVDKNNRRVNSQSCVFSGEDFQSSDEDRINNTPTYTNYSRNLDQHCFERTRDCNSTNSGSLPKNPCKILKMRSFDNNDELMSRNNIGGRTKFSTLDNRSRRTMRRQLSYNEFQCDKLRGQVTKPWNHVESQMGSRVIYDDVVDNGQTCVEDDAMLTPSICTCNDDHRGRMLFYDPRVSIHTYLPTLLGITAVYPKKVSRASQSHTNDSSALLRIKIGLEMTLRRVSDKL